MPITIAQTRKVYDIHEVQGALERVQERSPDLKAFYEQMIETGAERFVIFGCDGLPTNSELRFQPSQSD